MKFHSGYDGIDIRLGRSDGWHPRVTLGLAVDAVAEAETEYEPPLELVTPEMRERFYALVERELGVPRDYWPGHEPSDETVRLRLAYEGAELNAHPDDLKRGT